MAWQNLREDIESEFAELLVPDTLGLTLGKSTAAYFAEYYQRNRAYVTKRQREYYWANRDQVRAAQARWRAEHLDQERARDRARSAKGRVIKAFAIALAGLPKPRPYIRRTPK